MKKRKFSKKKKKNLREWRIENKIKKKLDQD